MAPSSIFESKFRRNITIFIILSSVLPLLILLFVIFQYVTPMLDQTQVQNFNPVFTYALLAMLVPSILSIALGYRWIGSIEKLSGEIKSKSKLIRGDTPHLNKDQNELAYIHVLFNEIHDDLLGKMKELDDVTKKLLEANIKLEKMATRDSLTSLYNRRYFDLRLIEEAGRSDRDKQVLSLMMIDFDNFKMYNDSYGHQTGDKLLREVAEIIRRSLRRSDMVFRYGGDEFAVLVPGCDILKAEQLANKLLNNVSENQFTSSTGESLDKITLSCGIAEYDGNLENFTSAADKCLHSAKAAGKGCVVISMK